MRCSDGVKRYNEERKKILFDEIIAAAERDNSADISHRNNNYAIIRDNKQEDSKMNEKTNSNARIKSSRGGLIAAACAVLVVGGGIFAVNHMNGNNGITAGSSGTGYTTDAEDKTSEDSKADDSKPDDSRAETEDDFIDLNDGDEYWRSEASEDAIRLVDGSDFIGDVQIVNILEENIDGVDYYDYICSLTDDNGNGGLIYKYRGSEVLSRFSIMQKKPESEDFYGSEDLRPKIGDKWLVMAKNGVQSASGGLSFELTEDTTMFKWNSETCMYTNIEKPGHMVGENEPGIYNNYENGLYEHDVDDYYKSMLGLMSYGNGIDVINKWCAFNNVELRIEEMLNSDQEKGEIAGIDWAGYPKEDGFNGVVVMIGDGSARDENGDYGDIDSGEIEELPANIIELNVHDGGETIEEFEDYNIKLGGLSYDSANCIYYATFDITKKDGTVFTETELDRSPIDLVYGDLKPYMDSLGASKVQMSYAWIYDDATTAEITLSAEIDGDPAFTEGAEIEINTIRAGEREIPGEFKVKFDIDITDTKE